jgi:tetratricopeptide (TPR) repeat protein
MAPAAEQTTGRTAESLENATRRLFEAQNYTAATTTCQELISRKPFSPWAYEMLGDITAAQGQWADAIHAYQQAIQFDPIDKAAIGKKLDTMIDAMRTNATPVRQPTTTVIAPPQPQPAPPAPSTPVVSRPATPEPATAEQIPPAPASAQPDSPEPVSPPGLPPPHLAPPGVVLHGGEPVIDHDDEPLPARRWLTPERALIIVLLATVLVLLSVLLTYHPWTPKYVPPTKVIVIPLE